MDFSPYQKAIFECLEGTSQSIAIEAVAGSGKTTTLVEAAKRVKSPGIAFLAFNKAIQVELEKRLPKNVEVKTFNAVGHGALMKLGAKFNIEKQGKIKSHMIDRLAPGMRRHIADIFKLASLAKSEGIIPSDPSIKAVNESLRPDVIEEWMELAAKHQLKAIECDGVILKGVCEAARHAVILSLQMKSEFDFADQIYFPFVFNLPLKRFKVLFVDEAQDVSRIQHYFIDNMLEPDIGRLILCGDSKQAIYGFRGSDHESIQRMVLKYNCKTLPLSISYRCPLSVILEAQRIVPQIEARAGAPAGRVASYRGLDLNQLDAGDMVLSRFNANLVETALKLLKRGIQFTYQGEDLSREIVAAIRRTKKREMVEIDIELSRLLEIAKGQQEEAEDPTRINRFVDVCEMAKCFISFGTSKSFEKLIEEIELFFRTGPNIKTGILLSTVHRAKGLEAQRVFLLAKPDRETKDGEKPKKQKPQWVIQQDQNLQYVAITRAQRELHFVEI